MDLTQIVQHPKFSSLNIIYNPYGKKIFQIKYNTMSVYQKNIKADSLQELLNAWNNCEDINEKSKTK